MLNISSEHGTVYGILPNDVIVAVGEMELKSKEEKSSPSRMQIGGDHYRHFKIQPGEFITKNGIGFLEGCVIKRMCRWQNKNGLEDLHKAMHEIQLIIEFNGLEEDLHNGEDNQ